MFAEVVFPLPFRNSFTYSVPEEFEEHVAVGVRVVCSFGKRILTGFVINTKSEIVYQINADNVNNCILPISDALCFLVNKENHTFKSSNRMFYL